MEYQSGAVSPVGSFSKGWEIIKNDYWMYVLMVLVFGIIYLAAALILGQITNMIGGAIAAALGAAMPTNPSEITSASAAIIPQVIIQVVGIFTSIIVTTIVAAFLCGIFKSMSKVASGGKAEFVDLFSGFENIQACFVFAVIMSVVQFVVGIAVLLGFAALGFSAFGLAIASIVKDGQIDMTILSGIIMVVLAYLAISIVIGLIIGALTTFVYPLIAERNLSGVQALGWSIKGGLANIIGLIFLLFFGWLMLFAGALPCLLGLPFLTPIYLAAVYAAYRSVFGAAGGHQNYNPPPPPNFGNQPGY